MSENKKFRETFGKLLLERVIPEKLDINEKIELITPLNEYVKKNIPKTFFRYRSFDNEGKNLNALRNNKMYFNTPNNFNDPHDCSVYIDYEKVKQEIKKIDLIEMNKFINENKNTKIYKDLFTREQRRKFSKNRIKLECLQKIQDNLCLEIKEKMKFLSDYYRSIPKIACLTEKRDDSPMWAYYADSHKGFVIEYDVEDLSSEMKIEGEKVFINCYPIIYSDFRFDATESAVAFAKKMVFQNFVGSLKCPSNPVELKDELFFIKANIFKHKDWHNEKEWRIWLNSKERDINFINIKPKAIYLGCKISKDNRDKIINIAKSIECKEIYQMLEDNSSPTYKLKYEKIEK